MTTKHDERERAAKDAADIAFLLMQLDRAEWARNLGSPAPDDPRPGSEDSAPQWTGDRAASSQGENRQRAGRFR